MQPCLLSLTEPPLGQWAPHGLFSGWLSLPLPSRWSRVNGEVHLPPIAPRSTLNLLTAALLLLVVLMLLTVLLALAPPTPGLPRPATRPLPSRLPL